MAQIPPARQTGYGHRLASKGIPTLLEVEKSPETAGTTRDSEGDPGADPQHERFECSLGSTEAAWGTAQARNRGVPGNGFEVHDKASEAAFTNVADVPGESYQAICVSRLLRGADREFPDPVRVPRSGS